MAINIWDDKYKSIIKEMLNEASNIGDQDTSVSYRYFGARISYSMDSGFPLLTCKKVEFDVSKQEVKTIIDSLNQSDIDNICNELLNKSSCVVKIPLEIDYNIYLEKAKGVLTLVLDRVDQNISVTPEEISKLALLLLVIGKTVEIKNLALQIDYVFYRMEEYQIDSLKYLLDKDSYDAPIVALKKQTSLYDYDPSYVTLRSYKYNE